MAKHNLNEEFINALDEKEKVNKSWRAFQDFLENTEPQLLEKFKTQANEIEKTLSAERDLYQ